MHFTEGILEAGVGGKYYEKILNFIIIRKMKIKKQDTIFHSRDGQKLGIRSDNL